MRCTTLLALWISVATAAGCGGAKSSTVGGPATHAVADPPRVAWRSALWRFPGFELTVPADFPEPREDGRMISSQATAAQIDASIPNAAAITVSINVYHSSEPEFARRTDVHDWANHPLPPGSVYRVQPVGTPRIETVQIPGATDAAISISLHDGVEQLGTGGERALSLRLFVKLRGDPGGYVVGAAATGDAKSPQLAPDSTVAHVLEQSLRTFRLRQPPASQP
jgi:hypothetical protein